MKIVRILIIITFSIIVKCSFTQEWVRTYTSTNSDGYGAWWVIESYDKGYVILADACNYKYGLIIKIDINGFEIWKKFFGTGSYHNVLKNIEQTLDFGYIIAGTTSKYGTLDAYILKLNSCFEKEWCKVLHTDNYYDDYGRQVKPLPDGGYLLLTAYYEGLEQGKRIHLHKFNQNGELMWQHAYAESDTLLFSEEGFDLNIINENEYLITGYCYYPDSGQYMGWRRPLLIKVDSTGTAYWETVWGATNYFYGRPWYNSIVDNKGDIYNMGYRVGENARYPVLIKTGNDGQEEFYSELVDTCYDGAGASPTWTEDSLIYATVGWQNWDESWFWGFFKIDTLGNIVNFKDITSPLVSIVSTAKTFDNKFISIGLFIDESSRKVIYAYKLNSDLEYDTLFTTPFVYDYLCPYEISSDTTDLDCDILVMVDEQFVPIKDVKLKVFPNPGRDKITISYPDITHTGKREIIILNSLGVQVKRIILMKGDEETLVDVSALPAGIYFVAMSDGGKRVAEGKMIVNR